MWKKIEQTGRISGSPGLSTSNYGVSLTAIRRQKFPDKYEVVETVKTQPGSKTMALDAKTHRLFIPAAKFKKAAASARPAMEPGTFSVQVYARAVIESLAYRATNPTEPTTQAWAVKL